jgi:glycosyltransferase involved in cell wall biosynthesis
LVRIVPDGTDVSLFKPLDKLECRRKLNWPFDERVVFFHEGGRPAVKRRDLADASLEEAKNLLGPCRLEVLDSDVPHDRVPLLLNASDCLLITSDFEGSPNIVREALACNLPIVSVDVGDVRRWIAGLEGTTMVSRDPAEIGRALAEIMISGIRPAGELKTAQFSDESSRNAVLETYHQVLNDMTKLRRS